MDWARRFDNQLIADAGRRRSSPAKPVRGDHPVRNINRTVGAMLSGEVAIRYGHAGLPEDTIALRFHGNAWPELRRRSPARAGCPWS